MCMERRTFLIGAGGIALGGSALLGSGAFSRVESQRMVNIEVAPDPDAYLGLVPLETPNSYNYVGLDEKGHLFVSIDEDGQAWEDSAADPRDDPRRSRWPDWRRCQLGLQDVLLFHVQHRKPGERDHRSLHR